MPGFGALAGQAVFPAEVPKSAADPGGSEPAGRAWAFPGATQVAGTMFHSLGDKDGEATATAWAGRVLKKAGDAEGAVRIFLISLQLSRDINAFEDMADTLLQIAPLLDHISPEMRQYPGVQSAAELIEGLDLNQRERPGSTRGNRKTPRWLRRRNT